MQSLMLKMKTYFNHSRESDSTSEISGQFGNGEVKLV